MTTALMGNEPLAQEDGESNEAQVAKMLEYESVELEEVALSEEEVRSCKDLFARMDLDNSGSIELSEFSSELQRLGFIDHQGIIAALFSKSDVDGNGSVDQQELQRIYPHLFDRCENRTHTWTERNNSVVISIRTSKVAAATQSTATVVSRIKDWAMHLESFISTLTLGICRHDAESALRGPIEVELELMRTKEPTLEVHAGELPRVVVSCAAVEHAYLLLALLALLGQNKLKLEFFSKAPRPQGISSVLELLAAGVTLHQFDLLEEQDPSLAEHGSPFWSLLTANAESWDRSEGNIGKVSARSILLGTFASA